MCDGGASAVCGSEALEIRLEISCSDVCFARKLSLELVRRLSGHSACRSAAMAGRFPSYSDAKSCKALKDQILKEQRMRLTSADGVRPARDHQPKTPLASKSMARFTTLYNNANPKAPPPTQFKAPLSFASKHPNGAYVYATPVFQPPPAFSNFSRPHTSIGTFRPPVR